MSKQILIVGLLSLTSAAFADESVVGEWRLANAECSSGRPNVDLSNPSDGNTLEIVFTSDKLLFKTKKLEKSDETAAAGALREIDFNLGQLRDLPDTALKSEIKGKLEHLREWTEKFASGVTCESTATFDYEVVGGELRTSSLQEKTSSCPFVEPFANGVAAMGGPIVVSGNELRLSNRGADADPLCPSGSFGTLVFKRTK